MDKCLGGNTSLNDLTYQVVADPLERYAPELADLYSHSQVPFYAHPDNLRTWQRHFRLQGLGVLVWSPSHQLVAVALFSLTSRHWRTEIVLSGHGWTDLHFLPAENTVAATCLAEGILELLRQHPKATLTLDQIRPNDPVVHALRARLAHCTMMEGDFLPQTRLPSERLPHRWGSKKLRHKGRRLPRRIQESGHTYSVARLSTESEVKASLPALLKLRAARERSLGRVDDFADPRSRQLFEHVILRYASRGSVQIWILYIDHEVAAYFVCIFEHGIFRIWDGRIATRWSAFSPGVILWTNMLQTWYPQQRVTQIDWMRGLTQFKRQITNELIVTSRLRAWPTASVRRSDIAVEKITTSLRTIWRYSKRKLPRLSDYVNELRRLRKERSLPTCSSNPIQDVPH